MAEKVLILRRVPELKRQAEEIAGKFPEPQVVEQKVYQELAVALGNLNRAN